MTCGACTTAARRCEFVPNRWSWIPSNRKVSFQDSRPRKSNWLMGKGICQIRLKIADLLIFQPSCTLYKSNGIGTHTAWFKQATTSQYEVVGKWRGKLLYGKCKVSWYARLCRNRFVRVRYSGCSLLYWTQNQDYLIVLIRDVSF